MDREVFVKCMRFLEVAYSGKLNITSDPEQLRVYYGMLGDLPEQVLMQTIQKIVATSKWPPTIADIREVAAETILPTSTKWFDAWETVQKAIRYCGMTDECGAYERMDELTSRAVRSMGWRNLCMSDNPVADRAHFQRIYEGLEKQQKENAAIPEALRMSIAQTKKGLLSNESTCLSGKTE